MFKNIWQLIFGFHFIINNKYLKKLTYRHSLFLNTSIFIPKKFMKTMSGFTKRRDNKGARPTKSTKTFIENKLKNKEVK